MKKIYEICCTKVKTCYNTYEIVKERQVVTACVIERLWLVKTILKAFMNLLSREINHFRGSPVITVSKSKDGTVFMTPLSTILFFFGGVYVYRKANRVLSKQRNL